MFKNYLKVAWRDLRRNKIVSFINMIGLAIGISASLVIFLLVNYHFTFDKFEKGGADIYRVVTDLNFSGVSYKNPGVCDPMADAVRSELTGLDALVPFRIWDDDERITVPAENKKESYRFKDEGSVIFADTNYFNLVKYQWLAGSPNSSLNSPFQTVLTESNAKLFFPLLTVPQVIGKHIYFNDTLTATVTGVVKDLDDNSDFTFRTFIAYSTLEYTSLKPDTWGQWDRTSSDQQLYIRLSPGTSAKDVEHAIAQLDRKYHKANPNDHSSAIHALQPLKELHFDAEYGAYHNAVASKSTLYGLLAIASFLLILGCTNFINLTTANSSNRAKEIGIRKTMGSSRAQLMLQFLCETFLLTFSATLLSLALTPLILKAFAGFIPQNLHFSAIAQPRFILFLFIQVILVTLVAGYYPAMVLSSYNPVVVLKSDTQYSAIGKTRGAWLRKSLTVFQFLIAQTFLMGTILVSKQMTFALTKDQGFRKESILNFHISYSDKNLKNKYVLMDKIRAIPEVSMVSLCLQPPSSSNTMTGNMKYNSGDREIITDVLQKYGDTGFIKLYRLKLLAGRNLQATDTVTEFLINENYSQALGFRKPEEAIGEFIKWKNKRIPVIGVVADFNQRAIQYPIKPMVIGSWGNIERDISIALAPQSADGENWTRAIDRIGEEFKKIYPKDDFIYSFFDRDIAKYYESEEHLSSLLVWSTGLAICISCLGLLGLVIYTTSHRTKEIGIRKVLGASVLQIVGLLMKDLITLVLIAFILATPVVWIGVSKWLNNFAYRTPVSWWVFLLGGLIMTAIALLTLAFQTIRTATANPIKSLRTE